MRPSRQHFSTTTMRSDELAFRPLVCLRAQRQRDREREGETTAADKGEQVVKQLGQLVSMDLIYFLFSVANE